MDKTLSEYLADLKELPDEILLGRIVMFTITNNPVLRDDVVQWFEDLDLNTRFLPAELRGIDAYKKATTDVDEYNYDRKDGTKSILLTRDVSTDREMIVRHIVREVRNSARKTLSHASVVEAVFYKQKVVNGHNAGGERLRLTRLNDGLYPDEIPTIDRVIADIEAKYDQYAQFLDGNKVRFMVREYLKYLNSLEIKGGVYFVHKNRTEELLRLRELVNRCGGGNRMDQIPLVDTANERDIVIEAFQREAEESLNEIVGEIAKVRSQRHSISPAAYAKLRERYDSVVNQALEYQRTLRLTQSRTSTAAELALDSLMELQAKMLGD